MTLLQMSLVSENRDNNCINIQRPERMCTYKKGVNTVKKNLRKKKKKGKNKPIAVATSLFVA